METNEHVCLWCGKPIDADRRSGIKFCSGKCRNRYNNAKYYQTAKEPQVLNEPGTPKPTPATIPTGNATMNDVLAELKEIRALLSHQAERVLSVDDVCRELGISKQTVERMVADGSIQLHRFGESSGTGRGRKPFVLFSELVESLKRG